MHSTRKEPSVGQRKRLRRIALRASQPVKDALQAGLISPRRADRLLYLEPAQQEQELAKILVARTQAAGRAKRVVEILQAHLATGTRDLVKLRGDLREALAAP
jgi:hypothetical protein